MHTVLLCATQRGLRFLNALLDLSPDDRVTVFSFPEEAREPRYLAEIEATAVARGAQFIEARNVYASATQSFWRQPLDLLLAVSWRFIVPKVAFEVPSRGAYVLHDSLLPKNRGFSPTVWAIANGEDHTGVTLFAMDSGVDTGDIVDQERVPIGKEDTIRHALDRTTDAYLLLLKRNLMALKAGTATRRAQDHSQATYCRKRTIEDNQLSWSQRTADSYNLIRAVTRPYSGAYTTLEGRRLTVWASQLAQESRPRIGPIPGTILDIHSGVGVEVATADGSLLITDVQLDDQPTASADKVITRRGARLGR